MSKTRQLSLLPGSLPGLFLAFHNPHPRLHGGQEGFPLCPLSVPCTAPPLHLAHWPSVSSPVSSVSLTNLWVLRTGAILDHPWTPTRWASPESPPHCRRGRHKTGRRHIAPWIHSKTEKEASVEANQVEDWLDLRPAVCALVQDRYTYLLHNSMLPAAGPWLHTLSLSFLVSKGWRTQNSAWQSCLEMTNIMAWKHFAKCLAPSKSSVMGRSYCDYCL